jgi:hypothetical protein
MRTANRVPRVPAWIVLPGRIQMSASCPLVWIAPEVQNASDQPAVQLEK